MRDLELFEFRFGTRKRRESVKQARLAAITSCRKRSVQRAGGETLKHDVLVGLVGAAGKLEPYAQNLVEDQYPAKHSLTDRPTSATTTLKELLMVYIVAEAMLLSSVKLP